MAQELRKVHDRCDGYRRPGQRDEEQRPAEARHLTEQYVRYAVDHVADDNGALVSVKAEGAAQPVADRPADDQSDARAAPDVSDAFGAAIENQLAEEVRLGPITVQLRCTAGSRVLILTYAAIGRR